MKVSCENCGFDDAWITDYRADGKQFMFCGNCRSILDRTKLDKIAIANSMQVEEWDGSGDELEYVLVSDTPENREKLRMIGADDEDMKIAVDGMDGEYLEISMIVFQYTDAEWFSPKRGGFLPARPEDGETGGTM